MATIKFRQGWERDVERSAEMRAALRGAGRDVADEAEQIGGDAAPTYSAEVVVDGESVRVEANTEGINAAAWIEFGTGHPAPTPAYAPLRRGAEAAGLKTSRAQK